MTVKLVQISQDRARALGLKRYFTGEPCRNGHIDERYVNGGRCCQCHVEAHRKHKASNPEWKINQCGHQAKYKGTVPGYYEFKAAERRAALYGATLELSDVDAARLKEVYRQCQAMNKRAGVIAYHVDHQISLNAGGKHHPDNLLILTAEENLKKHVKEEQPAKNWL